MEISRKKISTEEIIAKESDILEKIKEVKERYDAPFAEYGCEICAEYVKIGEYDDEYSEIDFDENNYVSGYVSRANFAIKKIVADPVEDDEEPADEESDDLSEEDKRVEKAARKAQAELERTVAYTEVMIVRVYKTFWKETVSICDNVETLESDFNEFLGKLKEMAKDE